MHFSAINQIVDVQPGKSITAIRRLEPDEDYLKDHFPRFRVMPGVLMLESLFQASAWLVRQSEQFAHSVVLLKAARQVKFGSFVEPGQVLTITATIMKRDEQLTHCKTSGTVEGKSAVSGRLVLESFDLADRAPSCTALDPYVSRQFAGMFKRLCQPADSRGAAGTEAY